MRKALIETATGKVVNVIELEPNADWQPPSGHYVRDALNASPGDTWNGTSFVKPVLPPEVDPDVELALAIAAATTLAELKAALLGQTRAAAVKGRKINA